MRFIALLFTLLVLAPAHAQIQIASGFERNSGVPLDVLSVRTDLTARDAIPSIVRYIGMTVFVQSEGKEYSLIGGITNSDWVEGGAGDIAGPASSEDNAITLFDGITGKVIKQSTLQIEDTLGSSLLFAPETATVGTGVTLRSGDTTSLTLSDLAGDLTLQAGEGPDPAQAGEISFLTSAVERLRILRDGIIEFAYGGALRLMDSGSNYIDIKAPATVSAPYELALPEDPPLAGKALIADGAGASIWGDAGSNSTTKNYFVDPFFDDDTTEARSYREQSASSTGFFDGGGTGYATLTAHGLTTGDPIRIYSSGNMPSPLVASTLYYAQVLDANIFGFSLTPSGPVISFTDSSGSGTYTVRKYVASHFTAGIQTPPSLVEGGNLSMTFTNDANSAVGEGLEIATKKIDKEDRGKTLYLSVSFAPAGPYKSDDYQFKVVDATNGKVISLLSGYQLKQIDAATPYLVPIYTSLSTAEILVSVHCVNDTATLSNSVYFGTWSLGVDTPMPTVGERVQEIDLTGSGNFTGGKVRLVKTGRSVTINAIATLTHASLSSASSAAGIIPEWARPTTGAWTVTYFDGSTRIFFQIAANGTLTTNYNAARADAGSPAALTMAYNVANSEGAMLSTTEVPYQTATVSAAGNAGQSITSGVTDIPFIETSDDYGLWNGSTLTPKKDSLVLIFGSLRSTAGVAPTIYAYVNGVQGESLGISDANNQTMQFAGAVKVPANQTLSIRAAGSFTLSNDTNRHWVKFLVWPDFSTFSTYFEPVMASYYCSAARTGSTSAPFNFDAKEFDTHGAVTTGASWRFTAPVPGTYEVSLIPTISSGSAQIYAYKNGVSYKNIGTIQDTAQDVNMGVTFPIQLNKNDYFDIRPGSSTTIGGGALTGSSISQVWIKRVGN